MPSRLPADKLRSGLPKVPGVPRRGQLTSATKRALVDQALALFTEHGYAGTSLDAIVAQANVTKGALYHHFSGKQAVFEAVFEKLESDAANRIRAALKGSRDPWEKALIGLRTFLTIVREPAYQRIVIQEGPAVLGYERYREQQEGSSFGLVQDMVRAVLEVSTYDLDEEMLDTFSRIFFGALSAAGESISSSPEPRLAVARVETALGFILQGLRTLADSGVELPDPTELLADDESAAASEDPEYPEV